MSTLSTIETKVRQLIGDNSESTKFADTYTTSAIFDLDEENIITVSIVYKNSVELDSGDWSYDSDTKKVTITASLTSGDTIEIDYTYYPNYSSTEIQSYIQGALIHISACNLFSWIVKDSTVHPEPTLKEENLIAMISALLVDKPVRSYRLPDVTITYAEDLSLHDKIRKTIAVFKKNIHGKFIIG